MRLGTRGAQVRHFFNSSREGGTFSRPNIPCFKLHGALGSSDMRAPGYILFLMQTSCIYAKLPSRSDRRGERSD